MYQTEGIILKKIDRGEADSLFVIYTKDFGKINVLARGVKKEGAKLRGHLETISLSRISFVVGGSGFHLTHAFLVYPWRSVCADANKFRAASYLVSVVDKYCFGWEREESLWVALVECFQGLETKSFDGSGLKVFLYNFLREFNKILGYGDERGMWVDAVESPF